MSPFGATGTNGTIYYSNGNVGIGTSNPLTTLEVNGTFTGATANFSNMVTASSGINSLVGRNTGATAGSNWGSFAVGTTTGVSIDASPALSSGTRSVITTNLTVNGGDGTSGSTSTFSVTNTGTWYVSINYTIYEFSIGITSLVLDLSVDGGAALTNSNRGYIQGTSIGQFNVSNTFIANLTSGTAYSLAITPTFSNSVNIPLHMFEISLFRLF